MTAAVGLPVGPPATGPAAPRSAPSGAGPGFAGVLHQVTARQDDADRRDATGRKDPVSGPADDEPDDPADDRPVQPDATTATAGLTGSGVPPWLQLALRATAAGSAAGAPAAVAVDPTASTAPVAAGVVGAAALPGAAAPVPPVPAPLAVGGTPGSPVEVHPAPPGAAVPTPGPPTGVPAPTSAPMSVPTAEPTAAAAPDHPPGRGTAQVDPTRVGPAGPATTGDVPAVDPAGMVTTDGVTTDGVTTDGVTTDGVTTDGVTAPAVAAPGAPTSQQGAGTRSGPDDGRPAPGPLPAPSAVTGAAGGDAPAPAAEPAAARVEDLSVDGGQPLPAAPPAPPVTAAPQTAAPAPTGPADPPVATQLAPQITALTSSDGSHSVTVVLAPESLGEVHVQLTVTGDQVTLTLASAHEHSRHALAEALPELRRELAASGLTLTGADVSADTTGSGSPGSQPGTAWAQQQGSGARPAPPGAWSQVPTVRGTADEDGDTTLLVRHTSTGSTSPGVDVRV